MYSNLDLKLIRVFGSKELMEGCVINLRDEDDYDDNGHICKLTQPSEYDKGGWYLIYPHTPYGATDVIHIEKDKDSIFEILGHIPHLEDVFRVAEEKNKIKRFEMNIDRNSLGVLGLRFYSDVGNWNANQVIEGYNPSLPLLEQSEETKKALITLFEQCK